MLFIKFKNSIQSGHSVHLVVGTGYIHCENYIEFIQTKH